MPQMSQPTEQKIWRSTCLPTSRERVQTHLLRGGGLCRGGTAPDAPASSYRKQSSRHRNSSTPVRQLDRMADRTEDSRAAQTEDLRVAYTHPGKAARRTRGSNRTGSANKSDRFCFSHAGSSLWQTPWKRKCDALLLRPVCDRMLVSS